MISIVVPTLWKYEPFLAFAIDLARLSVVDELIIINNNVKDTPVHDVWGHSKVRLINQDQNIGVNPAWNLGVGIARNEKVCILNDDLYFDVRLLYRINDYYHKNCGTIGLDPCDPAHSERVFTNGDFKIEPQVGNNMFGFGQLMFVSKSDWVDIPRELKYYYGDNFIYDRCRQKWGRNFRVYNLLHYTPYAVSSSSVFGEFEKETNFYNSILPDVAAGKYSQP